MKFLCENCKAKYQIADEKVAGKTVRMKCRKCGHMIEVRAAASEPPAAKGTLATSLAAAKPKTAHGQTPAPSALAGAFQRTVDESPAAPDIGLNVSEEWYVAINGVPVGPIRLSELRRKATSGLVNDDSLCWQEGLEEWRPVRSIPELAGIIREAAQGNRPSGIPPAPAKPSMPLAPGQRVPSSAGIAAVRPPLQRIPSSADVAAVRPPQQRIPSSADVAAVRPPQQRIPSAPAMNEVRPGTAPMAAPLAAAAPPQAPAPAPGPAAAPAARSNVIPLQGRLGSSDGDAAPGAAGNAALAPLASPAAPAAPAPIAFADPFAAPAKVADPFGAPTRPPSDVAAPTFAVAAPAVTSPGRVSEPARPSITPSLAPRPAKSGIPLWFWPFCILAVSFGLGAAVFLFRPAAPTPAPLVATTTTTTPTATPSGSVATGEVPPAGSAEAPTASAAVKPTIGGPRVASAAKTDPATAPGTTSKAADLSGLLPGAGGPSSGPGTTAAGGGGQGLDQAGVERVVANHRAGVKRTCWERGGADQKSSVNVTITATVAGNGTVANTSSSGDDPVVAKCIENQVKTWSFPAPGASTTINIPFKFVRQ